MGLREIIMLCTSLPIRQKHPNNRKPLVKHWQQHCLIPCGLLKDSGKLLFKATHTQERGPKPFMIDDPLVDTRDPLPKKSCHSYTIVALVADPTTYTSHNMSYQSVRFSMVLRCSGDNYRVTRLVCDKQGSGSTSYSYLN